MNLHDFFDKRTEKLQYKGDPRYKAWELLNRLTANMSPEEARNFLGTSGYIVKTNTGVEFLPNVKEVPQGTKGLFYKDGPFFRDQPGSYKHNAKLFFLSSDLKKYLDNMKKQQPTDEVRRMQELAGIKEMRVGPDGSLMNDEEAVKRAFQTRSSSFSKIINALHKDPSYQRAKEALRLWIKDIAEELGIDVAKVPMDHSVFTGRYPAIQALPAARKIFTDLLTGDLQEDDYREDPSNIPSGDTGVSNIAEVQELTADDVEMRLSDELTPEQMKDSRFSTNKGYVMFRWQYWNEAPDEVKNIIKQYYDLDVNSYYDDERGMLTYYKLSPLKGNVTEDDFGPITKSLSNNPLP